MAGFHCFSEFFLYESFIMDESLVKINLLCKDRQMDQQQ